MHVTLKSRLFSASKTAGITGVSRALQADWRRRGILPAKADRGWTQYDVEELIQLTLLGFFSGAGFFVKRCAFLADLGLSPTLDHICRMDGAVAGLDGLTDTERDRVIPPDPGASYIVALHGAGCDDHPAQHAYTVDSRYRIGRILAGAEGATLIDLWAIARRIVEGVGGPVFDVVKTEHAGAGAP